MSWLNNIRLAPKMIGSFVLVALLAGLVGAAGIKGINSLQQNVDSLTGDTVPSMLQIANVRDGVDFAFRFSRGVIMSTNPVQQRSFATKAQAGRNDALAQFQQYLAGITDPNSDEARIANYAQSHLTRSAGL